MDDGQAVAAPPHDGVAVAITDPAAWEMAKEVITDALKRPADERAAFVRERCPDPVLRDEIDKMLRAYDEDPGFLETPPHLEGERDELADLEPGTRVGPYVIVDRLGRGGMGQVFLSNDPRLHRKVALKCLIASRSLAADDRRGRILHEARAAARVSHPNIATVHDVIEHDGRAFIVMEYVEGESLAARLRRDRLPMDRAVAIGRQLAAALAAAHATNVIHRDLKPANIQLMPDGLVKVLDFGVAKALAMLSSTSARTTRAEARGVQVGTPGYMSPEQMLGRDVDERSDLFSLGVILFEMTTGRRPFEGADTFDLVLRLARRTLRAETDRAGVPPAVAEVIAKALEIDVNDRFQTALAIEAALTGVERESVGPSKKRAAMRAVVAIASVPVALGCLGYLTALAFNDTFGRLPPFDTDTPVDWVVLGFRAVVPTALWMGIMTVTWQAVRFLVRLLRLAPPVERALAAAQTRSARLASRLGLDDPVVLAQAIATIGFITLAAVVWRFWDLMLAWTGPISTSPATRFLPLRSDDLSDAWWYRFILNAAILVFGLALVRLVRLRAGRETKQGAGGIALVAIVVVLAILMNEVPYRIVWLSRFEKIDYAGARCYVIGAHADEMLVFCPDTAPPRNRVLTRTDPAIHKLGIVESVFTPAHRLRPVS